MTAKHNKFKLFVDRALSRSFGNQVALLMGVLIVTLLLSYVMLAWSGCDWRAFCEKKDLQPWLLPIYLLIDTNALNVLYLGGGVHGWMLIACSVTYLVGLIIFNGIIIGAITNYMSDRVKRHRDGLLNYAKSGHYIIMGYDDMVQSIITEIFGKDPKADVVLLTAQDIHMVKENLSRSVARGKMDQIFVTYGHCMVKDNYKDIHLEAADEIYIVGDRKRPAHDAINVECVDSIRYYLTGDVAQKPEEKEKKFPKRITCVFEDLDTYAAFKTTEIFSEIGDMGIEFVPYNFYAGWAHQVFVRRTYIEKSRPTEPIQYPSVYGNGIKPDDKRHVHLVFIGTSNFSVSFAMEAAHLLHFPNYSEKERAPKTRITFIEKNADEELMLFATRNRHYFEVQPYYYKDMGADCEISWQKKPKTDRLSKELDEHGFLDVEFEFIKGDAYSVSIQRMIREWAKDRDNQYLSIFLAMSDQKKNFVMGMNMPDEVYDNGVPVFIRQDRADDFVTNLRETDKSLRTKEGESVSYYYVDGGELKGIERKGRYANIYPFGMDDMAYCSDERAMKQAKLINYLYCNSDNNRFPDTLVLDAISADTIWKEAYDAWRGLKVAEKWSNLYSAYSIKCKLDSLRAMRGVDKDDSSSDQNPLSEDELCYMAAVEHNRWNVEKLLMGYRKARPEEDRYIHKSYGSEWKSNKKHYFIHSDIRPFSDLDEIQQMDFEIAKYIPWILSMTEGE